MRNKVKRRDNYHCVVCNKDVSAKGASRVDHIIPVKQDVRLAWDINNLRTLCASCDNNRHSEKNRNIERVAVSVSGYGKGWE